MPTELDEHETGGIELWFADDLEAEVFYLRDASVYEAEEVRKEERSEMPKFGNWLPVHSADESGEVHGSGWAVAVGELVEELQDFSLDPVEHHWTVTRCEKSGVEQTDPYEVNVEAVAGVDESQDRL